MGALPGTREGSVYCPARGKRFAARAGAVDDQDGFEGFELLQPTDGRTTWLCLEGHRDDVAAQAAVAAKKAKS